MEKRQNSYALAMDLHIFCIKPFIFYTIYQKAKNTLIPQKYTDDWQNDGILPKGPFWEDTIEK